jgi:hypothetical protein
LSLPELKYAPLKKYHKLKIDIILKCYLGYNCIEFENFTASIGDLMVAN